jgi:hypothetical protein
MVATSHHHSAALRHFNDHPSDQSGVLCPVRLIQSKASLMYSIPPNPQGFPDDAITLPLAAATRTGSGPNYANALARMSMVTQRLGRASRYSGLQNRHA